MTLILKVQIEKKKRKRKRKCKEKNKNNGGKKYKTPKNYGIIRKGVKVLVKVLVTQLFPTLCDPMNYSQQAFLSMESSMQEYWSG